MSREKRTVNVWLCCVGAPLLVKLQVSNYPRRDVTVVKQKKLTQNCKSNTRKKLSKMRQQMNLQASERSKLHQFAARLKT